MTLASARIVIYLKFFSTYAATPTAPILNVSIAWGNIASCFCLLLYLSLSDIWRRNLYFSYTFLGLYQKRYREISTFSLIPVQHFVEYGREFFSRDTNIQELCDFSQIDSARKWPSLWRRCARTSRPAGWVRSVLWSCLSHTHRMGAVTGPVYPEMASESGLLMSQPITDLMTPSGPHPSSWTSRTAGTSLSPNVCMCLDASNQVITIRFKGFLVGKIKVLGEMTLIWTHSLPGVLKNDAVFGIRRVIKKFFDFLIRNGTEVQKAYNHTVNSPRSPKSPKRRGSGQLRPKQWLNHPRKGNRPSLNQRSSKVQEMYEKWTNSCQNLMIPPLIPLTKVWYRPVIKPLPDFIHTNYFREVKETQN